MELFILSSPTASLGALQRLSEWAQELRLAHAWISSSAGKANHWKTLDLEKVTRAVVGIHFAQTEPAALRSLASPPGRLKVIDDTGGVFHPKVIIGLDGDAVRAILGSSNLTSGGYSGNTELNILLAGSVRDQPLTNIIDFIDDQWTSARAFAPDADWLARYATAYANRPSPPRVPQSKEAKPIAVELANDLDVNWDAYYALVAAQERRTLANGFELHVFDHPDGSYLQEIEGCQAAFARQPSFAQMTEDERKLVAGWGGGTSGYFGRMGGAGNFKKRVRLDPASIGTYLDTIPLAEPVTAETAKSYLEPILALEGVSVATATRLLAVKRPDYFLPINSGNRSRIHEIFGHAPSTPGGYADLHKRIWEFPWFSAQKPSDSDGQRIWKARVALLDTLLYELPS